MLLPEFEFFQPFSLLEAFDLKKRYGEKARLLAGGTDLLVHLKKGLIKPDIIISLLKINEMSLINREDDMVFIGACATISQLSTNPIIQESFPALKKGCDNLGSHLIRNRATIGGNVCNASPAGDTLCSLLIYEAVAILECADNKREIPIKEFFKGPGKTDIQPEEVLIGFRLPIPPHGSGADYMQLGKRKSSEINVVNVASYLEIDPISSKIVKAIIALGAVAPIPVRSTAAEEVLKDKIANEALFTKAGEVSRRLDCKPINDFRATSEYRAAMIGVLIKRTLSASFANAVQ